MSNVQDVCDFLDQIAPHHLAEDWDNVGLLVGDSSNEVTQVMTCLTITPASASEAIDRQAQLIVSHHPLPFRPLKRLTTECPTSRLLLQLIAAEIAVHSSHTAFDSAAGGINQQLAAGLQLGEIAPLNVVEGDPHGLGSGRQGRLAEPASLTEVANRLKTFLGLKGLHVVGLPDQPIQNIAVACGSAGEFLQSAAAAHCDLLVTGETSFHTCLEAEARGIALLLPGHYASERFAVETLADVLAKQFGDLTIWASQKESDPLCWM